LQVIDFQGIIIRGSLASSPTAAVPLFFIEKIRKIFQLVNSFLSTVFPQWGGRADLPFKKISSREARSGPYCGIPDEDARSILHDSDEIVVVCFVFFSVVVFKNEGPILH